MICPACNRSINDVDTCEHRTGLVTRLAERRWMIEAAPEWADIEFEDRCPNCNAGPNGYHHLYCTLAGCVLHDAQRMGEDCSCDDALLGGDPR